MPIHVEWQDETGEMLAEFEGPLITAALVERAAGTSCCLRFIDPWGNTTFNQQQLDVLLGELQTLAADPSAQEVRAAATALAAFIARTRGTVHTYVKFIGD